MRTITRAVAGLGLCKSFLDAFMSTVDVRPGERVLDVCAGTNAAGKARAEARGLRIEGVIGDVHSLPFPDATFDAVILQYVRGGACRGAALNRFPGCIPSHDPGRNDRLPSRGEAGVPGVGSPEG